MNTTPIPTKSVFHVILIKPSHYDDDGYAVQWASSLMPSNSLACLYGLGMDCAEHSVLGDDVEIKITPLDELHSRIKPKKIAKQLKASNARGFIGLVGVQSNQYPRALDLARQFRALDLPVCIGGFHVSGCLAMLPGVQPELQEAIDMGASLFAGEAEGRLAEVLQDAYNGEMKPIYNWINKLPDLHGASMPYLPTDYMDRYFTRESTFDAGRGCPYLCSFCTIINVQGRKSRQRSVEDIERLIRKNYQRGVHHYLITDDNFARNRIWEPILDCLIRLKEEEGIPLKLIMQVDALCHKIPNFIEKATRAGVNKVFIGIENLHAESLTNARKTQNRIEDYRKLLQKWRCGGAVTYVGYIIGFPDDTPERILSDIKTLQRELPLEIVEFNNLTPLPGSEDHKRKFEKGEWMDPDLNNYDLNHVTQEHPNMSRGEWEAAYRQAWKSYYTLDHLKTMLRRARATGLPIRSVFRMAFFMSGSYFVDGIHAPESGLFRRKYRTDRRSSLPRENPLVFYPRYGWEIISHSFRLARYYWQCAHVAKAVINDPQGEDYSDIAIEPIAEETESNVAA